MFIFIIMACAGATYNNIYYHYHINKHIYNRIYNKIYHHYHINKHIYNRIYNKILEQIIFKKQVLMNSLLILVCVLIQLIVVHLYKINS